MNFCLCICIDRTFIYAFDRHHDTFAFICSTGINAKVMGLIVHIDQMNNYIISVCAFPWNKTNDLCVASEQINQEI